MGRTANPNKTINIGKYKIIIIGNTKNITNHIVTNILYSRKIKKLNLIKSIFTLIKEFSYSVKSNEEINEQNTQTNTNIYDTQVTTTNTVTQFTKPEPETQQSKTESQYYSTHKNQGRTISDITIYL